jgi:hypothetical protein
MAERPSDRESRPPATPRWVKVFAVVAGVVIVLFLVLLLIGGHGPSRHGIRDQTPPASPAHELES